MYRTVGNMIEILTQKHNLRVEIMHGDDEDLGNGTPDDYFYVTVYNRITGKSEGWNYGFTLYAALDHLVNLKERGE